MKWRRLLWTGVAGTLLAGIAVLAPGSPAYLPDLLNGPGQYDGHSDRYWAGELASPDAAVRRHAAFALGATGTEAAPAVPALASVLTRDADPDVRREAALALYKIAPASREAVPALAQALGDESAPVRMNATMTLFRLRAQSRPAVPALIAVLQDQQQRDWGEDNPFHHSVREMAVRALGRAGAGAEAVPALTAALERGEPEAVRRAAAQALGAIGPEARSAEPELQAMTKESNTRLRQTAEEALRAITSAGPAATGSTGRTPP